MKRDPAETRRRILAAADELFYSAGIRSVGVDEIAEKAGITKRTLYYHFPSKDSLIAAYLEARDEPTLARYMRWLDESEGDLARQIVGMFGKLGGLAASSDWKGCGFLRAAAELAGTQGHPALQVGARHKKRFEAWLESRIAAAGLSDPARRARQVMVLLDGAVTEILVHRDPAYAESAGQVAAMLLTQDRQPA
jgi:AcrR family transcriptional regulator